MRSELAAFIAKPASTVDYWIALHKTYKSSDLQKIYGCHIAKSALEHTQPESERPYNSYFMDFALASTLTAQKFAYHSRLRHSLDSFLICQYLRANIVREYRTQSDSRVLFCPAESKLLRIQIGGCLPVWMDVGKCWIDSLKRYYSLIGEFLQEMVCGNNSNYSYFKQ